MSAMTTGLAGRLSAVLVVAMLLTIVMPVYAADTAIKGPVMISSITDSVGSININVGKGEGVKEGATGVVTRDGKQIAKYVVQQVNWGFSRITISDLAEGYTVRAGDSAPLTGGTEQPVTIKKKSSKTKQLLTILAIGAAVFFLGGGGGGSGSSGSLSLTAKKVTSGEDTRNITITATLRDNKGNLVGSGVPVRFSTNAGTLDRTETTTVSSGKATATLSYDPQNDPDTATVTVIAQGKTETIDVSFVTSIELVVEPLKIQVVGSGGTAMQATVTATCWDALGTMATSGEVKFSATKGTITPTTAQIGSDGVARATFTSSQVGEVDINATWLKSTISETVTVTAGPPYDITLTANPTSATVTDNTSVTINANVRDIKGNPVADGTVVNFSVTPDASGGGNGRFMTSQAVTDRGLAVAYLETKDSLGALSKPGTATVRVDVLRADQPEDVPAPTTDRFKTTTVQFVAQVSPEVADITLSVKAGEKSNIRGWDRSGNTTKIVAAVKNGDGLPVPNGTAVSFSTTDGFITAQSTTTNGFAEATLTTDGQGSGDGTVDITATSGSITETAEDLVIFSGAPLLANCTVTVAPDTLPAVNGQASIDVTASDLNNHPVADGTTVKVTTTKGTVGGAGTTVGGSCQLTLSTSTDVGSPTPAGVGTVTAVIDNVVTLTRTFTVNP